MRPKVKICGITNAEDGALALALGADELGFVLAPSPRRVEPEAARSILEALRGEPGLPPFRAIGVFVNEGEGAMRDILSFSGLDAAQVHGDEDPVACAAFDFPWYRALRIGSVADALSLVGTAWPCPRLLVDASSRTLYGGTGGRIGAWAALAARALARGAGKEFFIAGGIGPRSAASVIHSLSPDGVDVSSGVEERPGKKSAAKMEALFAEISRASAHASEYAKARAGAATEAEGAADAAR
jgi:phosphoribosylanthranilate isomerase